MGPTIKHHEMLLQSFNDSNIIHLTLVECHLKIQWWRWWWCWYYEDTFWWRWWCRWYYPTIFGTLFSHFVGQRWRRGMMMLSFVLPRVHFVGQRWGRGMENQQIAQTNLLLHTCFQWLSQEIQNLLFRCASLEPTQVIGGWVIVSNSGH